ncbi:MAG TPA: sulfatase-like hydrolase/transferase, partial [Polyangiaceae bacterium]|nr:sulfatase-like hydrolase/transferase [Polyangiaceae bacterium]
MTASWAALVAVDLVGRAGFLLPRLETLRGLCNYAAASLALWIVLRLVFMVRPRPRVALFAAFVAAPMAIQWGMFRAYGQFIEPTDLVELADSPRVALSAIATGAGSYGIGAFFVGLLAMACAWLLPPEARPLRARWAVPASAALSLSFALGASYWRASPTLEHSQPAFGCTVAGLLHRATVLSRAGAHVSVPPMPSPAPRPNIVLIVGESLAASHLGLYGYARDTSPRLQALADAHELVAFRDATVMGPNTRTSVPYILTGLEGPDAGGRIFRAPTVIEYAKARGYHTA